MAWLAACAGEPAAALDLPVIAGCESESYAACDVLEAGCQARVFATVACLRDMPAAARPEIRTITRAEYEAELVEPVAATEAGQDPDELALGDSEDDELSVGHALELLGLAEPADLSSDSFVELYAETVPGYYSTEDRRVTLIDSGAEGRSDPGQNTLLLAHEYLHALQDQEVDLTTIGQASDTFDQFLATRSVVEGEAVMFESFFGAAMWRLQGQVDFRSHFTSWVDAEEEQYADKSPLLVAPRYFPYSYGARFVYDVFERGGVAAVRALYGDIPKSVLAMMPSESSLAAPEVESLAELPVPAPPLDYALVTEDTLGPWVFSKFLKRSISEYAVSQLASHWRGDRFFVYARGESSVTGVWALRFDELAAAEQFVTMLEGGANMNLASTAFAVPDGRDVAVAVSDDASSAADWLASISEAQATSGPEVRPAGAPPLSSAMRRRLLRVRPVPPANWR